ncbi:MAG TPA: pyridoxal phosphate-dependent aminotransferase family protein, partial [Actinomycetota bacterium]|nr:pyridoxal phosphate-dependent aminotransferase family protein [Actinomycetota bacterium]
SNALVGQISRKSETRTHASPPTLADLHAADSALRMNISDGEAMRRRLFARVLRFRRGATALGMNLIKTLFPTQQFGPLTPRAAERMARVLLASGIKTAAVHGHRAGGVAFLIRADMSAGDIDRAIHALSAARVPVASLGAAS